MADQAPPTISLRDYIDRRFDDLQEIVELRFNANQLAVETADKTMSHRLEASNNSLGYIKEQNQKFGAEIHSLRMELGQSITRLEEKVVGHAGLDLMLEPLLKDVDTLKRAYATEVGKASQNSLFLTFGVAILGLILGIANLWAILREVP